MDDDKIRLTKCFAAVFPDLPAEEIEDATMDTVPSWDSIAMLTLCTVIEEELRVAIDPRDRVELGSFARMLDHVRRAKR